MKIRKLEYHGRETYAVFYGDGFVLKRPLPNFGPEAQQNWLKKQHKTQNNINEIRSIKNPAYNVPEMIHINDDELQVLEERAPGFHLTRDLYRGLARRQRFEIANGIASFLVDMNELKPVKDLVSPPHKISKDIKFAKFENFVENKMEKFFYKNEIKYMIKLKQGIESFEYQTREAWSHGDLNSGNVLYDPETSKLSFIDFAEAGYKLIYNDIFAPLQVELGISKHVYEIYSRFHDKSKFIMPGIRNDSLQEIMKYKIMTIYLKRFIKAAEDLRLNPVGQKGLGNNVNKIRFMKEQIQNFQNLEKQFTK